MVADFYAYENKAILDVGCGYGGVLSALTERFQPARALGIDLDAEMVRSGQVRVAAGVRLEVRDFWLQFLPPERFRRLLRLEGNSYKSGRGLDADIESVLRTRLTLAQFRRTMERARFRPLYYRQFLVRPDYRVKFGLPTISFPAVPLLDELLCTGAEAVLERQG